MCGRFVQERSLTQVSELFDAEIRPVSDGYLATLGIPVVSGRGFNGSDVDGAPPVAVINDALAHRFFKNENPIGRRVTLGRQAGLEIVGVVANAKYLSLREEDLPTIYVDAFQKRAEGPIKVIHVALE